ncbi:CD225/dispanin family protein [Sphingobacterium sp. SRCM116780]|uniref:CD225/dispanin family protein n=1 Tax=Sphingobacterium sp. SRCM116780 TaxID=2907623 RepID=UPI001F26B042|nr:CD225/dispanin family protein [Sphingobacterium sp. SRCM116780]UIR57889.1 CD225/dispanin family protein [Sphingobacterium sp. SRCM116780]
MRKYFYTDGYTNFGPFTLEELKYKNITRETYVWYQGLAQWYQAVDLPELAILFSNSSPAVPNPFHTEQTPEVISHNPLFNNQQNNPFNSPQNTPFNSSQNNPFNNPQQVIPRTWLVESILVTIFCCLPFGIVGIANAAKVESKFYAGDFEGSQRASDEAKKWTKISFFVQIALYASYLVFILLGIAGSISTNGN